MPAPGYRWWVGDRRTGKLLRQVDLTGGTWSIDIAAGGSMEGSFPLLSKEWPTWRADTAASKAFLAVAYIAEDGTETFLDAGPMTPGKFTENGGILAVSGAGLKANYDRRKVLPPLAPGANPAKVKIVYYAHQVALIQKRLVQLAHEHLGGAMPVVFPSDEDLGGVPVDIEAAGVLSQVYNGYELKWIGEQLKQLAESDGGAEFQFVPRRRTPDPSDPDDADAETHLEWVMRLGTPETGFMITQTGDPWVFDRSVPDSTVIDIEVDPDASRKTHRSFAAGTGDAENRAIGWSEDLTDVVENGYALTESEVTSTDQMECVKDLVKLTDADLQANASAWEFWTVRVHRDSQPNVGQYRPGDVQRIRTRDHYYIPDGEHDRRIVRMSGDPSAVVTLVMAPTTLEGLSGSETYALGSLGAGEGPIGGGY